MLTVSIATTAVLLGVQGVRADRARPRRSREILACNLAAGLLLALTVVARMNGLVTG